MEYRDTTIGPNEVMPWNTLTPKCLIFDTRVPTWKGDKLEGGNFYSEHMEEQTKGWGVLDNKTFVWVIKTTSLKHFDPATHFHWTFEGFNGGNFMRLLQQEYRSDIDLMQRRKLDLEKDIYPALAQKIIYDKELVARFPMDNTVVFQTPNAQKQIAVLLCKKTQPVNGVTSARIELYNPVVNAASITPGMSQMLSEQAK